MKKPLAILLSIFITTAIIGLGFRVALALNYIDFSGADTQDIRWPAGQTLSFVQGGSERLRIDATTGNVVIPQGLTVNGTFSMTGTYTGSVSAGNISAGDFGSNYGGGIFSFPGNVGIGTTADTGTDYSNNRLFMTGETHMVSQGAHVWFGDSTIANPIGIGEGLVNSLGADNDFMSLYYRNSLRFFSNTATERMRIDVSGNVGIGTTSPGAKLDVNGTLNAHNAMTVQAGAGNIVGGLSWASTDNGQLYLNNGGATTINIMGSGNTYFNGGNVGIGTTGPSLKLTVDSGVSGAPATSGTSQSGGAVRMDGADNGVLDFGELNDGLGSWWIQATDKTDLSAKYKLLLNPNGGNVGIGTTGPVSTLQIKGAYGTWGTVLIGDPGVTTSTSLALGAGNSAASRTWQFLTNDAVEGDLAIRQSTTQTGSTFATKVTINPNGNVGIGTTSPAVKLDIEGNLKIYNGGGGWSYVLAADGRQLSLGVDNGISLNLTGGNVGIGTTVPGYSLTVGQNTAGNNTDYSLGILRHGTLASPGAYTSATPAFAVSDVSTDGPAAGVDTTGLVSYYFPRIADGDTYAGNATIFTMGNDSGNALRVDAKRNTWISWDRASTSPQVGALIVQGGNVGIGYTDTSGNKLAVNGTIYATTINASASGGLCIAGDCKTAWSQVGGGAWTLSGNNLYPNSTTYNVGIGTTGPGFKLDVNTATNADGIKIGAGSTGAESSANIYIYPSSASAAQRNWLISTFYEAAGMLSFRNSNVARGDPYGAGTTRMVIDTSGNVGIGTTSPVAGLDVAMDNGVRIGTKANVGNFLYLNKYSSATSNNLVFQSAGTTNARIRFGDGITNRLDIDNGTTGNERMSIRLDTGNVGIGTTSPNRGMLDIRASGQSILALRGQGEGEVGDHIEFYMNAGQGAGLREGVMYANTYGANGFGIMMQGAAPIWFGTTNSERMRITGAGNVGIGTNSPSGKLQVAGADPLVAYFGNGSVTQYSNLVLSVDNGNSQIWKNGSAGGTSWGGANSLNIYSSNGPIAFHPNDTANVLYLSSGGNVGIGYTDTSGNKLAVNGAIYSPTSITAGTQLCIGASCQSSWPGSQWTTSGANIYNSNSGNVGIGTTSPSKKLTVAGEIQLNGYPTGLYLGNGQGFFDNGGGGLNITSGAALTLSSGGNIILTGGNVGIGTTAPVANLHIQGAVSGLLFDGSTSVPEIKPAGSNVDLRLSAIGTGGWLALRTNGTDRVIVSADGNVGIGTTGPNKKLHILDTSDGNLVYGLKLENGAAPETANTATGILFAAGDTATNPRGKGGLIYNLPSGSVWGKGDFHFLQNTASNATNAGLSDSVMTIKNTGNVGIGTTSPSGTLTIKPQLNGWDDGIKLISNDGARTFNIHPEAGAGYGLMFSGSGQGFYFTSGSTKIYDGLIAGGVDNGSVIFYRSSNPYSIGATDAVLTVSDRSGSDWGIIVDKSGYDYGVRVDVASSASYAFAAYNGSSYAFRVLGDGQVYAASTIYAANGVVFAGSQYIYNGDGSYIYVRSNSGAGAIRLIDNAGNSEGWLYGNGGTFGLLDTGGNWAVYMDQSSNWYVNKLCTKSSGYCLGSTPTSYGTFYTDSGKNGYYGMLFGTGTSAPNFMWDTGGNGGIYYENWGWLWYTLSSNHNIMVGSSNTASYRLTVDGDIGTYNQTQIYARYTTNESYKGSFNWYGLQLGNNGNNYIIGGRTAAGGNLNFVVNNTSDFPTVNGTTAMTILSNGNVGIGTTSPAYKLHVVGTIYAEGASNGVYATFLNSGSGSYDETISGRNVILQPSSGNVGIGTTSPTSKLHITPSSGTGAFRASVAGSSSTSGDLSVGYFIGGEVYATLWSRNYGWIGVLGEGGGYNPSIGGWGTGVYGVSGTIYSYGDGTGVLGATVNGSGVRGASTGASGYGVYCNSSNNVNGCGGNRAWYNASDERLKKNITTIENALEKVKKLRGVNYVWKDDAQNRAQIGFIAQEVLPVVSEVVGKGPDGYYTMSAGSLTAVLVEAVKELASSASGQKDEIAALASRLARNDKEIDNLLAMMGRFTIDENGTLTVKKVVTDELELGGYCVKVKEGKLEASKGKCE